jgi:NurA-like 5'-3' nuclease
MEIKMQNTIIKNSVLKYETLNSVALTLLEILQKKRVFTKWVYSMLCEALFDIQRRQYNLALDCADLAIAENVEENEIVAIDKPYFDTLDNLVDLLIFTEDLPVAA